MKVHSCSIGFCVAITKKGVSSLKVLFHILTCFSAIASSRADCTLEGALFISSASIKFVKIGHFFTSNSFVFGLYIFDQIRSDGSKSGVNWILLNHRSIVFEMVSTVSVFARPGAHSIKICPHDKTQISISLIRFFCHITFLATSSLRICNFSFGFSIFFI